MDEQDITVNDDYSSRLNELAGCSLFLSAQDLITGTKYLLRQNVYS